MQKHISTQRGTGLKTHMKKQLGKHISTHTQTHSDEQEEHAKITCVQKQVNSQTQACARRQTYTEPHPYRLTKRWCVQMYAETYLQFYTHRDTPHGCADRHRDPQMHTCTNRAHRYMQTHACPLTCACWHRNVCTHISRAQHTFSHTYTCTDTCVYSHLYACKHACIHQRHAQTNTGTEAHPRTQTNKIPMHIESSHAHSDINICTWTHRCMHPVIQRNSLSCRRM